RSVRARAGAGGAGAPSGAEPFVGMCSQRQKRRRLSELCPMTSPAAQSQDVLSFGPFSLVASERLLTREGTRVELGTRSLDILIALLANPNEVVSKRDLLARVWPDVTVEESSLRFHVANLRKALGDRRDGARYITTLAGRGYCFVAPVSRSRN